LRTIRPAPGRWVTAAHVVRDEHDPAVVKVRIEGEWHDAQVVHGDSENDLAVLAADAAGRADAKLARSLPSPGSNIQVVGWTRGDDHETRVTFDYVVQAPVCENLIVATGPPPPRGFGGAAAIELSTGRVAGLMSSYRHGQQNDYGPGTTDEARVVPLSLLPLSFR